MLPDDRRMQMQIEFTCRYGTDPVVWTSAPGRVDLMGSHTDYNQGFVLTMAIDRDTVIVARPRADGVVRIASHNLAGEAIFNLDSIDHDRAIPWTNYVRGVAAALKEAGYALQGFDGLIDSTLPLSSGLSSSAALEVATANLFDRLGDLKLDPVHKALLCQKAENGFVGMNCGILDQYTSAICPPESAILLDCRHLTHQEVPLPEGLRVVLCDTQFKRELTGSEYPERRSQCEQAAAVFAGAYPGVTHLRDVSLEQLDLLSGQLPEVVVRRARFIIEENRRVVELAQALRGSDRLAIQRLTAASFAGAGALYEIVVPQMEAMMAAMRQAPGFIGGRQAGAGFGGCMLAFVEASQVAAFAHQVEGAYTSVTSIRPKVFAV